MPTPGVARKELQEKPAFRLSDGTMPANAEQSYRKARYKSVVPRSLLDLPPLCYKEPSGPLVASTGFRALLLDGPIALSKEVYVEQGVSFCTPSLRYV